jgi:Type VI secretion system, TssN
MMTNLTPLLFIFGLGFVLFILFLSIFKLDQNDWRTSLYLLFMILVGGLTGLWLHFESEKNLLHLPNIYISLQVIFLLLGIGHIWWMYRKLFWSKRDSFWIENDSFWPELLYTLAILFLMSAGLLGAYGYFEVDFSNITHYWGICILFVVPFLFFKSYDFFNQIPQRDFSQRWVFTNDRIGEDNWDWVNEIWVQFEVKENLVSERLKKGRLASFRIEAPRKVPLRETFRLAVREYNSKAPDINVQDLGFEQENVGHFWWLFSIKFVWRRPETWFRKIRYLNPYSSPVKNEIRPNDIVVARRMNLNSAIEEEEEIPMGEL